MRAILHTVALSFFLVQVCLAAVWSLHPSCVDTDTLKSTTGILAGFKEAIARAKLASSIMEVSKTNPRVEAMCKLVLGTDNYDASFAQAKATFDAVASFPDTPDADVVGSDAWNAKRTPNDIEIYCDSSRFVTDSDTGIYRDTSWIRPSGKFVPVGTVTFDTLTQCQDAKFVPLPGVGAGRAFTRIPAFKTNIFPGCANEIDICSWYRRTMSSQGWPTLNSAMIAMVRTDEYRNGLSPTQAPVDGLKTLGSTMLHEITHTITGGRLNDIQTGVDATGNPVRDCYDWKNVVKVKDVRNSDSISMLGIALQIWSMGYWVDADGVVQDYNSASLGT